MIKLTPRQAEILGFIKRCLEDNGFPPTRAEIAQELGFKSPNAAEEHLKALARKGVIEMTSGRSRCADSGSATHRRVLQHQPAFFHPSANYLLRVHGMSMKDVGILDGDLLAVHTTREARNGQIVVARIGDEVTVKRFKREGSKVWLLAENPDFAPIEVDLKDQELVIEGLSVGVIRR